MKEQEARRTVRIPVELDEQLKQIAKYQDRTVAAVIRVALTEYAEARGKIIKKS